MDGARGLGIGDPVPWGLLPPRGRTRAKGHARGTTPGPREAGRGASAAPRMEKVSDRQALGAERRVEGRTGPITSMRAPVSRLAAIPRKRFESRTNPSRLAAQSWSCTGRAGASAIR